MRLLKYLTSLFSNGDRGTFLRSETHKPKSDAVRLMEIELLIKTMPVCPHRKALEDCFEIFTRQIKHLEDQIQGYDKGR